MKILFAAFNSAEEFLSRLDVGQSPAAGLLTVSTKAKFKKGERVILEIGYPGLPNRVLIRANARDDDPELPVVTDESQCFELTPGEEHKRDFLVAVAAGRAQASWQRKHRRFPVRLPARFIADGDDAPVRGDAETEDVGSGGVFLKTSRALPEGTRLTVVLDPCDGSAEMEFLGRVVYTRGDAGDAGVGIQFDKLTADDMKRLRRMIRDVKLRGKVTEWEDASGAF